MPHDSALFKAFVRRGVNDFIMFGFVQGITTTLPSVGVEKALAIFAKQYGITDFNVVSEHRRYSRMLNEYHDDRKTPVGASESV